MPDVETSSIQINISAQDSASAVISKIQKKLESFGETITKVQALWNDFSANTSALQAMKETGEAVKKASGDVTESVKEANKAASTAPNTQGIDKVKQSLEGVADEAKKVDTITWAKSLSKTDILRMKLEDAKKRLLELTSVSPENQNSSAITKTIEQIQRYEQAIDKATKDAAKDATTNLDGIGSKAKQTGDDFDKAGKDAQSFANSLGISFKGVTKTVSLLGILQGLTKMLQMRFEMLKKAASGIVEAFKGVIVITSKLIKVTAQASVAVGKVFGRAAIAPIALMGKAIGGVVSKLHEMFAGIVRIATYRLFRSMIKWITQGLSEGIQNLYQWSKALDQSFSKAMDLYATSRQYMNNSFAAMLEPIIEELVPLLDQAVDKAVELMNKFNQMFSALTGKSTWTKALKVATEYDEATKQAKKDTDELRRSLLGFDEINRLEGDKNKGSSSKGDEKDYSSMFVEMPIDSVFGDLAKKVKELIESGNWYEAGVTLAEKLNELIDAWQPEQMGKILAQKINNAVDLARGFLTTANWKKLGAKFAATINNLLYTINAKNIGKLIANILNSAFNLALGFLETIDGKAIGKNLSDIFNGFFEEIDAKTIGDTISTLLGKALDIGISYFQNLNTDAFYDSIIELIDSIEFGDLGNQFAELFNSIVDVIDADKISEIFSKLITGIADFLINSVGNMNIEGMVVKLTTILANLLSDTTTITKLAKASETLIKAVITAIGTFISTFPTNKLFEAITTFFKGINWNEIGSMIGTSLQGAIKDIDPQTIGEAIGTVFNSALDLLGSISDKMSELTTITVDVQPDGTEIQEQMTYWEALGFKIGAAISNALNTIDWEEAGETLSNLGVGITSMIRKAIETADKDGKLSQALDDLMRTIDWMTIAENLMIIIADAQSVIWTALKELGKAIAKVIWEGIKDFFSLNIGETLRNFASSFNTSGGTSWYVPDTTETTQKLQTETAVTDEEISSILSGAKYYNDQPTYIQVDVDGDGLFEIMIDKNNKTVRQTGSSPLMSGR